MNADLFDQIRAHVQDMELDAVWDYAIEASSEYSQQCEFFLEVLEELLRSDAIKLINMYTKIPLEGTIEHQLEVFRSALPKDAAAMRRGLWFFQKECPGGCLWGHG